MIKKLNILKKIIIILLVVLTVLFVVNKIFGFDTNFRFYEKSISDDKIPDEFKDFSIAYISDLNISDKNSITYLKNKVTELNNKDVDMVLFGGDIYDSSVFENNQITKILKSIHTKYGKFAVLGDKDQSDNACTTILNEAGFEVLHNEIRNIYYKGACINLIGLENNGDCSTLINEQNKNNYKIVMVHQPDYFDDVKKNNIQLQLSGHTLGGYIKIPLFGGMETKELGKKYVSGTHTSKNKKLIISDGFNKESTQNYRFLTKNEILILKLK